MIRASHMRLIAVTGLALVALGGCATVKNIFSSSDKKPQIFVGSAGPETKKQVKELPKGLASDKANANYSFEDLRGGE